MGPKRYRAGVEPQVQESKDADDAKDDVFETVIARGHSAPTRRKVVQAQILSDGIYVASSEKVKEIPGTEKSEQPAANDFTENFKSVGTGKIIKELSSSGSDSDSDSSSGASSDSNSNESSSSDSRPPSQITFVPKSMRIDMATKAEEKARYEMELQIKKKRERQEQSREMASESIARKTAEQEGPGSEDEEGYPDDTDRKNDFEYQAWKTREILRLNRNQTAV